MKSADPREWKPWIAIEPEDSESPATLELYQKTRKNGRVSDLVKITSRTPKVARLLHELAEAVYQTPSGLTWREKEIAALITSSFNGCVH